MSEIRQDEFEIVPRFASSGNWFEAVSESCETYPFNPEIGVHEEEPNFVMKHAFENVGGFPGGLSWTGQQMAGNDGEYRGEVKMVPQYGRYTYRAVAVGYEPTVSESTPFGEEETTVDFELQPVKK